MKHISRHSPNLKTQLTGYFPVYCLIKNALFIVLFKSHCDF